MIRVAVKPVLLKWAMDRSQKPYSVIEKRFPKLKAWIKGEAQPTQRQIQDFAGATSTPLGYFFLSEPPDERLPIPDFRTMTYKALHTPSAHLLETIYAMQRRQAWLRESMIDAGVAPLDFAGVARLGDKPETIAHDMRRAVGLGRGWAEGVRTWREALGELRRAIENLGVMAVINGVVANNTHRKLDVKEFRGFALCDQYAPLIFVNGADTKSAQMFTLAHELAHIWLGSEGVSGYEGPFPKGDVVEELYCDRVAAEFLVPESEIRSCWTEASASDSPFEDLARRFKISPIVAGRRAMDMGLVTRTTFYDFYKSYCAQELHLEAKKKEKGKSGGDFFNNQNTRVGERFAKEVFRAAKEGRLLFREAYRLTGLYGETFSKYARHLGIDL